MTGTQVFLVCFDFSKPSVSNTAASPTPDGAGANLLRQEDQMTRNIHAEKIVILDFGSQYTQLIARRIREIGVFCEIVGYEINEEELLAMGADGFILSGGPESVTEDRPPRAPEKVFTSGVPVLGICYGMQTMASQLGGVVEGSSKQEFGYARVTVSKDNDLLRGIADSRVGGESQLDVWMSHGDKVVGLPPGFDGNATTETTEFASISNPAGKLYGVQFHPEVNDTRQGEALLRRFVGDICGCEGLWRAENIIDDIVTNVRERVGTNRVILGLSGGVDSSVVAALLSRAIGDQLTCVFVDNGLLRAGEVEQVVDMLGKGSDNVFSLDIVPVDASDRFLTALAGVTSPEEKRKIIGRTFIDVFDEEAGRLTDVKFLAQGTIYPDVIESAGNKGSKAHVIKSHHNVGGLPEFMKLELIEPLRELFKDEVRKIGVTLGLSQEMVGRHPFPGPGLSVRILGDVKKEYADLLRQADKIFIDELLRAGLYNEVSQAFAVFLPVKAVGVVGDARRYEYVVTLRAVETVDFMTARWAHLPYDFLERVSSRIMNEVAGIARVAYDISSKPPATIEWE
jgi:GMP synthase (glutamine-hydrolysing)